MANDEQADLDLPDGDRGLGDLLGAFIGAAGGNESGGGSSDILGGLLGGLMEGGNTPSGGSAPQAGPGGMDLDSILDMMGSDQAGASPATGGGGMGDLLGGLMGGAGSAGGMGGLLGGLLGSMGGGSQTDTFGGGGGMMMPFAQTLSDKLGISPQVANVLVTAAMGLIMSKITQQRRGVGSAQGLTMNSLMDADYLRESGVAAQVAEQTGMDEDEAIRGLQEALSTAGQQAAKPSPGSQTDSGDDLKGLLDSWD